MSRKKRILIVDDDIDTLENLMDILSDAGYQTEAACNGQVALEKVEGTRSKPGIQFDVCLLDFRMPELDGVKLASKIHDSNSKLPTIMMTAYAGDDGVQQALAGGILHVLPKPVDIETLLEMIGQIAAD